MTNDHTALIAPFQNRNVEKVYRYYLKGLNAMEIGKLLDISPRTVQRYIKVHKFKELMAPRALQQKALELYQRGYSYREIGQVIRKSRTTVYYYLKQIRVTVK